MQPADRSEPAAEGGCAALIDRVLRERELQFERISPTEFVVNLPGEKRLKTATWLIIGSQSLSIEAFVVRKPDENHAEVYAYLLRKNARQYAVAWSIDDVGDIYLSGRVPLAAIDEEEVDRILGSVLEYADGSFNQILKLGFGTSIRKEWEWRVKAGESLANLKAFEDWITAKSS